MATIERRKGPAGKTVYRARIRRKGYPDQTATFSRLTEAKNWAAITESDIVQGRHFVTAKSKRHTLGEAIDRYLDDDVTGLSVTEQRNRKRQLGWWKAEFGHATMAQLCNDPDPIHLAKSKLGRGKTRANTPRSPATVKRYLAALSRLFTCAMDWGWATTNPVARVRKPREPEGRNRFLSDDERKALLEATEASKDPYLHTAVLMALATGARKGEILWLRWGDVSLPRKTVTFRKTKNNESRTVPLLGSALEAVRGLSKVRRLDSDLLFPWNKTDGPKTIDVAWQKARLVAGLEDFRFHDLRHSAGSYLAMSGATPSEIAAVLGHKTLQMVKRYAHVGEQHTADVLSRMHERYLS